MLYLSQKWSNCHETKNKHSDWTLGLKCDHRVWPWPWPRPRFFKVKYRICYISAKNGPIATKQKAYISIGLLVSNVTIGFDLCHKIDLEFSKRSNIDLLYLSQKWFDCHEMKSKHIDWTPRPQNVTIRFDLDHNLDLWIFKVKHDLDLWPHTWPWPWIFMVKLWNSCISEWEGRLTLHKGGGSRSFMTMTMTIWWPRSGVWIYQIVTGVISVVGVLSTHLVLIKISLGTVPRGPINHILGLVQIMACCQPGVKPFSEPIMVSLLRHICITPPQWVKY